MSGPWAKYQEKWLEVSSYLGENRGETARDPTTARTRQGTAALPRGGEERGQRRETGSGQSGGTPSPAVG